MPHDKAMDEVILNDPGGQVFRVFALEGEGARVKEVLDKMVRAYETEGQPPQRTPDELRRMHDGAMHRYHLWGEGASSRAMGEYALAVELRTQLEDMGEEV